MKYINAMVLIVLLALSAPFTAAGTPNRTALIIGNADYQESPLKNPVNDARDIATVLKKKGFSVTLKLNANQRTMERAIRNFGTDLRKGGIGLFYFAGHGLRVHGNNYLIPLGSIIETEGDVKYEAVDAGLVLAKMEDAGNDMNIVILDACRNNPFARSFRSGSSRGLARMDAPKGSLVAYATAPGSVAADGDGENGVYTKHLIRNIDKPGMDVEDVLKSVRIAVVSETGNRQIPWESSSLMGSFYFTSAPNPEPRSETQIVRTPPPPKKPANDSFEILFWESIKDSDNPAMFEAYLEEFPNGTFSTLAQINIRKLKAASKPIAVEKPAMPPKPKAPPLKKTSNNFNKTETRIAAKTQPKTTGVTSSTDSRLKLAVLQFKPKTNYWNEQSLEGIQYFLKKNSKIRLVASYYSIDIPKRDAPFRDLSTSEYHNTQIFKPAFGWSAPTPNIDAISKIGEKIGADIILTGTISTHGSDPIEGNVSLYLTNVKNKKMVHGKFHTGTMEGYCKEKTQKLFTELYNRLLPLN